MSKKIVGMVHVRALPGTPRHSMSLAMIVTKAVEEAAVFVAHGFDAIIIENMHDTPYLMRKVGPEILACMTAVGCAIRARFPRLEIGVQILAGANREAIACAQAFDGSFVRCEGFVFASVADEGIMAEAAAGELLRYRRNIGAAHVKIFCDIKKKHSSHAITADVSLAETAKAADFFGADGVIVTGTSTGSPTDLDDVRAARHATKLPVAVGSGVDPVNIKQLWPLADIFIVGSYIKKDGNWANELDVERIKTLMNVVRELRSASAAAPNGHASK